MVEHLTVVVFNRSVSNGRWFESASPETILLFIHLNNNINVVGSLIKVVDDTTPLSPILIDTSVSFYNILDRINRIENKNNWISINNLEIQLKDVGSIIIPDGNYLLYLIIIVR